MKIYNIIYSPYPIRRKLKTNRENIIKDLAKKIEKQEEDVVVRMKNAIEIYGNKYTTELDLDKLEKTLNAKQKDMILLEDIYKTESKEYDSDILNYMADLLIRFRFINKITIGQSGSEYIICYKPNTDVYIKPYIREGDDNIYIEEHLVVSPELAENLQKKCKDFWGDI